MAMFDRVHSLQANNSNFYHIAGNQTQIFNNYDPGAGDDRLLADLNPIERSLFVEECMQGTRADVIALINNWMDDINSPNIFWLKGAPGAGKSAIAATMVAQLRNRRRLGSHFFFKSGHDTLSNPINLWRTFAADLAKFDPYFRTKILEVLKDRRVDPTAPDIRAHFQCLIQEPLQSGLQSLSRFPVFIVDAFDECASQEPHRKMLLDTFKRWAEVPREFKLLITSRDYHDIATALRRVSLNHILQTGDLVDPNSYNDIYIYLSTHFQDIATSVEYDEILPPDWPGSAVIEQLTKHAAGLFIWATTIVKLFEADIEEPNQQLSLILADSSQSNIDQLYSQILDSAFRQSSPQHINAYKVVVGGIIAAKIPLCKADLICLLGLPESDTLPALILRKLRPVVSAENLDTCLHISHQSFSDFICDLSRCPDRYVINCRESNDSFAANCLKIMSHPTTGLRFNICQFPTSHLSNDTVHDLPDQIRMKISSCLSYSCHFWMDHTGASSVSSSLLQEINTFMTTKFLYWLEALSLIKSMSTASSALRLLLQTCKTAHSELFLLAEDALKFVNAFHAPISHSIPHIYLSALPFAPSKSLVSQTYLPEFPGTLQLQMGKALDWPPILNVLEGHNNRVYSVAFSPDGKHIVSGSDDNTVRVWDADSGELIFGPFEGHTGRVASVAFSPDGKHVVSGSSDETAQVWDVESGKAISEPFKEQADWITSVAFSPDGKHIVSGSHDKTLRVWNAKSGQVISGPLEGHTGWVMSVAFSPDGKYIASGSDDKTVRVWDVELGKIISGSFIGHTERVTSVAFSPDGKHVVSGSWDKTVRVWNAHSGKAILKSFVGHTGVVNSVAFSPDGKCVVSGSSDKTVRVWDAESGKLISRPFLGHIRSVNSVAFSPDGKHVSSGSHDNTVRVWNAESGKVILESFEGHTDRITFVAFLSDGKHVVSGSDDRAIQVWDVESGDMNMISGRFKGQYNGITSVALSPNGKHIVSASEPQGTTVQVWNVESGQIISRPFEGHTERVTSVAFSPNGKHIVSGSEDKTVRVWDAELGNIISGPLSGHIAGVTSVAFSPDGRCVVSGSWDNTARVWDVNSGEVISGLFEVHTDRVTSVAFSPDGMYVVSGSWDKTITVWDAQSGKVISGPFEGHTDVVATVAFSPDGKHIVSGSWDKTVRVWNAKSGKISSGPFKGHADRVTSVAFSPDGKHIVSGDNDGTVQVWVVKPGKVSSVPFEGYALALTETSMLQSGGSTFSDYGYTGPCDHTKLLDSPSTSNAHISYTDGSRFHDGWMHGQNGELLFWVPPSHRNALWRPNNRIVIGQNSTRLGLCQFVHGTEWMQCWAR